MHCRGRSNQAHLEVKRRCLAVFKQANEKGKLVPWPLKECIDMGLIVYVEWYIDGARNSPTASLGFLIW